MKIILHFSLHKLIIQPSYTTHEHLTKFPIKHRSSTQPIQVLQVQVYSPLTQSLTILMLSWFLFLKQDKTHSPLMESFISPLSLSLFSKFPETAPPCVQTIPGNSPSNFNGSLKVLPYLFCVFFAM